MPSESSVTASARNIEDEAENDITPQTTDVTEKENVSGLCLGFFFVMCIFLPKVQLAKMLSFSHMLCFMVKGTDGWYPNKW